MAKRAIRRHHLIRMKKKAIKIWSRIWGEEESDWPVKNANHIKSCSCSSCCNPRRSLLVAGAKKMTIQERKVFNEDSDREVFFSDDENQI